MPLEYSYEDRLFRVDVDVLETFVRGSSEHRILLAWLAVQIFPVARGQLALRIRSAPQGTPLYEMVPKPKVTTGLRAAVQLNISPEGEPVPREFFSHVAKLCGRAMAA